MSNRKLKRYDIEKFVRMQLDMAGIALLVVNPDLGQRIEETKEQIVEAILGTLTEDSKPEGVTGPEGQGDGEGAKRT